MKLNIYQKVCLGLFFFIVIVQIGINIEGLREGFYIDLYSFLLGLTPLIAGTIALRKYHLWSGFRSAIGKAVFFVGLGIFFWSIGEMIWFYYNSSLNIILPYPSFSDLFYLPGVFFYGLGAVYFSSATGVKFSFKSNYAKVLVALTSIAVLFLSYYLIIIVARHGVLISEGSNPIKTFLDLAYPLGDFMGLLVAVVISGLSFNYLGGKYKYDILAILLGIGFMFIGDVLFSYTTTIGTYYNANLGDFSFAVGTFLLSFGVLGFCKLKDD